MTSVKAICRRSGDWWAVEVPDLPGVFTQARRIDQVEAMVRDAITTSGFPKRVDVELVVRLPEDVEARIVGAAHAQREAERATQHAASTAREVVGDLRALGLSMRDVGAVLGVSHQRVSQLASKGPRPLR
ncbi:MAG: XRE family transcriptional regulator [Acidimicrobiia bacterium]|nr:XRE family transcriptional regulator [Acidimicrobiia bacterium]